MDERGSLMPRPPMQATRRTTGPTLDATRLQELEALGPRAVALVDRAIDNLVTALPRILRDLEEAFERHDTDEVGTAAHRLRGSALNLGLGRVAEIALSLELRADRTETADVPRLLEELSVAGAEAETALRQYQRSRDATPRT